MKRTSKVLLLTSIAILSSVSLFAQLGPLPGDPLPGDPDPGIEVPLDGGVLIVMNTREELHHAFDELDKGTFIKHS